MLLRMGHKRSCRASAHANIILQFPLISPIHGPNFRPHVRNFQRRFATTDHLFIEFLNMFPCRTRAPGALTTSLRGRRQIGQEGAGIPPNAKNAGRCTKPMQPLHHRPVGADLPISNQIRQEPHRGHTSATSGPRTRR